jgi:hypothetical protein
MLTEPSAVKRVATPTPSRRQVAILSGAGFRPAAAPGADPLRNDRQQMDDSVRSGRRRRDWASGYGTERGPDASPQAHTLQISDPVLMVLVPTGKRKGCTAAWNVPGLCSLRRCFVASDAVGASADCQRLCEPVA